MYQDCKSNRESPVILITGGAKRIGAYIVKSLHQNGYRVIIHYCYAEEAAKNLCHSLNALKPNSAAIFQADFNDFSQIDECIRFAQTVWQRLDGVINNGSSFFPTRVGETSLADWQQLMNSNLMAPYFLIQAAIPSLLKSPLSQVINIIDIHGERPLKDFAVYSIAKAGLVMLTKSLAKELGPKIRVNGISPGVTLWPEKQKLSLEEKKALIERAVLKRLTRLEDISETVLYLFRQFSMTGEILHLDCGRLLK